MPHPLLRGGHAQTLAGFYYPGVAATQLQPVSHRVALDDNDLICLHEDRSEDWQPGGPTVLLVHGLAGNHLSPYLQRIAYKLCRIGMRTFRMELRGCGTSYGLARNPYNAWVSQDVRCAIEHVERLCPDSPLCVVGFSLGGNLVLKLAGETPERIPAAVRSIAAVCPPIDLIQAALSLKRFPNLLYSRFFARLLNREIQQFSARIEELGLHSPANLPRTLLEFDDFYTAPMAGFQGAMDYYQKASAQNWIDRIQHPTYIIAAADDPLIPVNAFQALQYPPHVTLQVARSGGHMGFIARQGIDPDRRWMDWRVVDWVKRTFGC